MGEPIREATREEPKQLPYVIEDVTTSRGVKKTKITTEQRMLDTDVYCLEKSRELVQKLRDGSLGLSPEAAMMNESVFSDLDVVQWGKIRGTIHKPWWDDDELLKMEAEAERMDAARPPEDRMRRYLEGSREGE